MMQEAVKNRELISALADGQLHGEEFARTVEWLDQTADARLTWHAYHVVGDVLRSGDAMASASDGAFVQRLKLRLQPEVPRLSDQFATDSIAIGEVTTGVLAVKASEDRAANDGSFRWKMLAGVASMAFVALIGWQATGGSGEQAGAPMLAQTLIQVPGQTKPAEVALQQTVVAGEPQVMIRDQQLDALLAAHKQFGGTSALQVPTGFLRNATFEGVAR